MSKEDNKTEVKTFTKIKNFFKSAAFAWLIIWTIAVMFAGIVTGWTMRSDDNAMNSATIEKTITSVVKSLE